MSVASEGKKDDTTNMRAGLCSRLFLQWSNDYAKVKIIRLRNAMSYRLLRKMLGSSNRANASTTPTVAGTLTGSNTKRLRRKGAQVGRGSSGR